MELNESRNRFDESMKRAISRCKELAIALQTPMWNDIADSLNGLRLKGVTMANAKGRSKFEIESDINSHKDILTLKQESVQ